jgi:hypothetical protein
LYSPINKLASNGKAAFDAENDGVRAYCESYVIDGDSAQITVIATKRKKKKKENKAQSITHQLKMLQPWSKNGKG